MASHLWDGGLLLATRRKPRTFSQMHENSGGFCGQGGAPSKNKKKRRGNMLFQYVAAPCQLHLINFPFYEACVREKFKLLTSEYMQCVACVSQSNARCAHPLTCMRHAKGRAHHEALADQAAWLPSGREASFARLSPSPPVSQMTRQSHAN